MSAQSLNDAPVIQVENLAAAYDRGQPVFENVSFSVPRGMCFGIMGLNGAGKTTLIKTIVGLRDTLSGSIRIMGQPRDSAAARQRVAFLPERFEPAWFLTGYEFLEFSARFYGVRHKREAYDEAALTLALDPAALAKQVRVYSKGMRQKLGLLGTVMTSCDLLILDEPMSGLDPQARALTKDLIRRVLAQGKTIFLCSHVLNDMEEVCHEVMLLHKGRVLFEGKPRDLAARSPDKNIENAFLALIREN